MNEDDNAYESLAAAHGGEERWAFGTGFDDPLAGVDQAVPAGVDESLRCLELGDDALVLSQRLAAWCGNAPELEDEMALANIALDLLGQARLLLTRAVTIEPALRPTAAAPSVPAEDAMAYFRDERSWRNVRLAELDDHLDFAACVVRLAVLTIWRLGVLGTATASQDPVLAAIAAKAVIEGTYHREYATGWLIRLGDGTAESHDRMQRALDAAWPYVDELFADGDRTEFDAVLDAVLDAATLHRPDRTARAGVAGATGRDGVHTEAMGYLLAELQSVARAHPDATW